MTGIASQLDMYIESVLLLFPLVGVLLYWYRKHVRSAVLFVPYFAMQPVRSINNPQHQRWPPGDQLSLPRVPVVQPYSVPTPVASSSSSGQAPTGASQPVDPAAVAENLQALNLNEAPAVVVPPPADAPAVAADVVVAAKPNDITAAVDLLKNAPADIALQVLLELVPALAGICHPAVAAPAAVSAPSEADKSAALKALGPPPRFSGEFDDQPAAAGVTHNLSEFLDAILMRLPFLSSCMTSSLFLWSNLSPKARKHLENAQPPLTKDSNFDDLCGCLAEGPWAFTSDLAVLERIRSLRFDPAGKVTIVDFLITVEYYFTLLKSLTDADKVHHVLCCFPRWLHDKVKRVPTTMNSWPDYSTFRQFLTSPDQAATFTSSGPAFGRRPSYAAVARPKPFRHHPSGHTRGDRTSGAPSLPGPPKFHAGAGSSGSRKRSSEVDTGSKMSRQKCLETRSCFYCGKPGHQAKDCVHRRK